MIRPYDGTSAVHSNTAFTNTNTNLADYGPQAPDGAPLNGYHDNIPTPPFDFSIMHSPPTTHPVIYPGNPDYQPPWRNEKSRCCTPVPPLGEDLYKSTNVPEWWIFMSLCNRTEERRKLKDGWRSTWSKLEDAARGEVQFDWELKEESREEESQEEREEREERERKAREIEVRKREQEKEREEWDREMWEIEQSEMRDKEWEWMERAWSGC
jgi:hypothetical protein